MKVCVVWLGDILFAFYQNDILFERLNDIIVFLHWMRFVIFTDVWWWWECFLECTVVNLSSAGERREELYIRSWVERVDFVRWGYIICAGWYELQEDKLFLCFLTWNDNIQWTFFLLASLWQSKFFKQREDKKLKNWRNSSSKCYFGLYCWEKSWLKKVFKKLKKTRSGMFYCEIFSGIVYSLGFLVSAKAQVPEGHY